MKRTKEQLTPTQRKLVRKFLRKKPVEGEVIEVHLCTTCGNISAHQYIPYSIGRGVTFNMCMCQAVGGSNWHNKECRVVGRRMSRRAYANSRVKRHA